MARPKDITREQTGAQTSGDPLLEQTFWAGNFLYANGGNPDNPMGFPGYGRLYTGSYTTYRWMLKHPILRLVRSIAVSPIVASRWEYVKTEDGVPDEWVELVTRTFNPLRVHLLNDFFVRGRDYGWAGGEVRWETRRNASRKHETIIASVKPLLHELTTILTDDGGNFAGLRNYSGKQVDLQPPFKAWKFTYDSEAGYAYGQSWLESVRNTAWKDWLDCAQQLQRLGAKITGIVSIITSPAGTFPGPNGTKVSYRDNAEAAIKALSRGAAGVWFPSLGLMPDAKGNLDAMKVLTELAGKSLTNINPLDFGSNSPAITGILERMRHDEELMFAGGLRPSRTGLEGKHGTKAEAETHTDTGTTNSENDDQFFASECQPLVDSLLMVNYGDDAKGAVRIQTPPLVDRKASLMRALLLAFQTNQQVTAELAATVDLDEMLDFLEIKRKKSFNGDAVLEAMKKPEPAPAANKGAQPEPQGGRPKEK